MESTAESFKMNFDMIRSCSIKIHEEWQQIELILNFSM